MTKITHLYSVRNIVLLQFIHQSSVFKTVLPYAKKLSFNDKRSSLEIGPPIFILFPIFGRIFFRRSSKFPSSIIKKFFNWFDLPVVALVPKNDGRRDHLAA